MSLFTFILVLIVIYYFRTTISSLFSATASSLEYSAKLAESRVARATKEQSRMFDKRLKADILSAEDSLEKEVKPLLERRSEVKNTLDQLDQIDIDE